MTTTPERPMVSVETDDVEMITLSPDGVTNLPTGAITHGLRVGDHRLTLSQARQLDRIYDSGGIDPRDTIRPLGRVRTGDDRADFEIIGISRDTGALVIYVAPWSLYKKLPLILLPD